jgi:protein SCO1/2
MSRVVVVCALPLLLFMNACSLHSSLPDLGAVPAFKLTDETGVAFGNETLANKIWIANFIFTTCHGPCPRMSAQMKKLQAQTKDMSDVNLVSFTIDPENDTPTALSVYAKTYEADPDHWHFLTGPAMELNKVSYDGFHLAHIGGPLEHSSKFALVDRKGTIRGYYESNDPDAVKQLLEDVIQLRKEVM